MPGLHHGLRDFAQRNLGLRFCRPDGISVPFRAVLPDPARSARL